MSVLGYYRKCHKSLMGSLIRLSSTNMARGYPTQPIFFTLGYMLCFNDDFFGRHSMASFFFFLVVPDGFSIRSEWVPASLLTLPLSARVVLL